MNKIKFFILLSVICLWSFTALHKYYVSVTEINYSESEKSFQIISRIFFDDLELLLKERYGIEAKLDMPDEHKLTDYYIETYLSEKLTISLNGEKLKINMLGKEFDNDIIKCYLEIPNIMLLEKNQVEIQNQIFFELFEDQQNIVHVKTGEKKKSFILLSGNDKAMLNF